MQPHLDGQRCRDGISPPVAIGHDVIPSSLDSASFADLVLDKGVVVTGIPRVPLFPLSYWPRCVSGDDGVGHCSLLGPKVGVHNIINYDKRRGGLDTTRLCNNIPSLLTFWRSKGAPSSGPLASVHTSQGFYGIQPPGRQFGAKPSPVNASCSISCCCDVAEKRRLERLGNFLQKTSLWVPISARIVAQQAQDGGCSALHLIPERFAVILEEVFARLLELAAAGGLLS